MGGVVIVEERFFVPWLIVIGGAVGGSIHFEVGWGGSIVGLGISGGISQLGGCCGVGTGRKGALMQSGSSWRLREERAMW